MTTATKLHKPAAFMPKLEPEHNTDIPEIDLQELDLHNLTKELRLIAHQAKEDAAEAADSAHRALHSVLELASRATQATVLAVPKQGRRYADAPACREQARANNYAAMAKVSASQATTNANLAEFFHATATRAADQACTAARLSSPTHADRKNQPTRMAKQALTLAEQAAHHKGRAQRAAKEAIEALRDF